jgi:hypothetical protein
MKPLLAIALLVVPLTAHAQGTINLNAAADINSDCYASGTITKSVTWDCSSNAGVVLSFVASVVPAADDDDVIGVSTTLELQSSSTHTPDWWRVDSRGCRTGAVRAIQDSTTTAGCPTVWDHQTELIPVFAVDQSPDGPNRSAIPGRRSCG